MDITADDSKNAGVRNERLVIDLLRDQGPLSQAMICTITGLGSSTISYIVRRLREKGLILEKVGHSTRRGAKPVLIDINSTGQFIIGTEINPSYLLIGLFDFNANLVDDIKLSLKLDHSVEKVVHLLEVNVKGLLSKNDIASDKLVGVGVTLSGSISSEGKVQLSSPLGWRNVSLKENLSQIFHCSVDIYTTKVRLLAEMDVQPPLLSKNIVYLNVANGVGSTVLVDGKIIHGATNRCGELGHVVIDPEGPLCGCGQQGCLEAHISGPAIMKKIKDDIAAGKNSALAELINSQDTPEDNVKKLKQAVESKDPYAIEIREFIADRLSRSAAMAINLFDPDSLILAGYVSEMCPDYFAEHINHRFESDVYDQSSRNIQVISARAGQQALISGVAAAVLQEQFKVE
ncbi:MAG: ROK family transcriptional regulator [Planctomycetota bacterium]|jgi:predicted NBD/HSP70 family sugar kinase